MGVGTPVGGPVRLSLDPMWTRMHGGPTLQGLCPELSSYTPFTRDGADSLEDKGQAGEASLRSQH